MAIVNPSFTPFSAAPFRLEQQLVNGQRPADLAQRGNELLGFQSPDQFVGNALPYCQPYQPAYPPQLQLLQQMLRLMMQLLAQLLGGSSVPVNRISEDRVAFYVESTTLPRLPQEPSLTGFRKIVIDRRILDVNPVEVWFNDAGTVYKRVTPGFVPTQYRTPTWYGPGQVPLY